MKFGFMLLGATACAALVPSAAYAQGQPLVAVAKIDDNAGSGQSNTLTQMILTAVAATQKFRVIERGQLDVLVQEQQRGKSGLVKTRDGGATGGFEAADYLIYGTITTLSATKKSNIGASLGMSMIGGNQGSDSNCYSGEVTLSLDIRIADASTGQIRYVQRIDESKKAGTICGEGVPQTNATELFRTASDRVASGLVTSVYPIKVAAVQGDGSMVVNYGTGTLALHDYVTVFRPGQSIVDPDTGRVLGSSEELVGIAQITDVQNSFSKARPIAGFDSPAAASDIARPSTTDDFGRYPKVRFTKGKRNDKK